MPPPTEPESARASPSAKRDFGPLYDKLVDLLYRHDPIGIAFGHNLDEYEPEVDTILPRLASCSNATDATRVVHEELVRWFTRDGAGPLEDHTACGAAVWALWEEHVAQGREESEAEPPEVVVPG